VPLRLTISLLWAAALLAQPRLEFEVASVKASVVVRPANVESTPGEDLTIINVPLRKIVTYAYQIRDFQLAGAPGWIADQRYDIAAKSARLEGELPGDHSVRVREKLRSLLADRFHLEAHHGAKEQSILVLTVAKNGPKLKIVTTPGERQGISVLDDRLQGFAATMPSLAVQLANATGYVVEDRTGLAEKYDFVLTWTPDSQPSTGPTIFTALRDQLGLRLDPGKGSVDVLVVDRIEQPSEN
jgi:uncharacterized protein (TIGR03435 family)